MTETALAALPPPALPPDKAAPRRRLLRDHPPGLWVLFATELWDRISFHGMQALLTLYMVEQLLLPGHVEHVAGWTRYRSLVEGVTGPLSAQALAAQTFGLYSGLIYFTPVIGGSLGDRLLGRRVSVALGALLMTAGHLAMAFEQSFLLALLLLVLGAGLLRGNLSAQIKAMYADGDPRSADGFQIYYLAVNVGAFIAPIITGALAVAYGWHVGFGVAGVGMMLGLMIYLAGQRWLPDDRQRRAAVTRAALSRDERRRVLTLVLLLPVIACFWVAQSQVWNVYNLWVRDHLDLSVRGFQVPVPWMQALDGLAPVFLVPVFLGYWQRQAKRGREPDDLGKIALGCIIFGGSTAWLALAPLVAGADGRAPLFWGVAFHFLSNIGWLYVAPIALAMYAATAPAGVRGTMIGVSTLSVFVGSVASGRLGGFYERMDPSAFWLMHAAIATVGGLVLWLVARPARRRLAGGVEAAIR